MESLSNSGRAETNLNLPASGLEHVPAWDGSFETLSIGEPRMQRAEYADIATNDSSTIMKCSGATAGKAAQALMTSHGDHDEKEVDDNASLASSSASRPTRITMPIPLAAVYSGTVTSTDASDTSASASDGYSTGQGTPLPGPSVGARLRNMSQEVAQQHAIRPMLRTESRTATRGSICSGTSLSRSGS